MSLKDLYEKVDAAIIYLSQNDWMDKWKIQKGVFYYIWLDSIKNNYNFISIINKLGYVPFKQGPYSEFIDGEVEMLIKDDFLQTKDPESKILPVKATKSGISEFLTEIQKDEIVYLEDIRKLLESLNSEEVIFFIYFHPFIPKEIKDFFISKSEVRNSLTHKSNQIIKKLMRLEIIDQTMERKIEQEIKKMA